jgi:PBP1b-binding outer membrane lipoprotein LpoB
MRLLVILAILLTGCVRHYPSPPHYLEYQLRETTPIP